MTYRNNSRRGRLGNAVAALAIVTGSVTATASADAQTRTYRPSTNTLLSIGEGQVVNLPSSVADVWVSSPDVADVHITNPRQLNLFGKKFGETTLIATAANGSVVYATNVRVSQNLSSVNEMIRAVMPESNISVTSVGQIAVINGTVASPEDSAQAQAIITSYLNPGKKEGDALDILPINRLRTATPLQVNLKVRIAEVSRTALKQVGVNLLTRDTTGGTLFGIGRGNPGTIGDTGVTFNNLTGGTTLGLFGKVFGLDVLGTLDLLENDGLVTTLAEPNLTALSGETASFLAGGEFPVPISQSLGAVTVEYKNFGVGLAFTPIVLGDGRISMRVRPEVSELSEAGAVKLGDFTVPALTTRRAETTVELGSGQSFMIAGLLRNVNNNNLEKTPFLGDLPILGTLFRSTKFQRQETELVIVVTPYLVRPISGQLALPTNGYRAPTAPQQAIEGQNFIGVSGPRPTPISPAPSITGASAATVASPGFKL